MHSHEMFVCCLVFNWMVQIISTDVYTYKRYASDLLMGYHSACFRTFTVRSANWLVVHVGSLPVYLFTVPYVKPTC